MTNCTTSTLPTREIYRGDSDQFSITFKDSLGVLQDISGWLIKLTVRENYPTTSSDDTDALFTSTATIFSGASGMAEFDISPEQTQVDVGVKVYDIQYTKPDGAKRTVGVGKYTIKNDVTRG